MAGVSALTLAECEWVGRLLEKHRSDRVFSDIWQFGLNIPFRISDLLQLRLHDCVTKERDDEGVLRDVIRVVEIKTSKSQKAVVNGAAWEIINRRRQAHPGDVYLFQSHSNRAGSKQKPINRSSVYKAFSEMGEIIGGRKIGCHTTRKSRGKAMYDQGIPIEKICSVLNHSSPAVTMKYIGIEQRDVDKTYELEIRTQTL
ncbi:tyrosine-type recombinase/integrase [Photobacterium sp. ZSDE20]|uniref:Tyrosine-type recombinase/integrase n=1 Tax=Photobacterium pectinilyticum TaxID=2906793 RepID=A0ABT1NC98_9GAMM|nr:tyrosine-type recombinase/integrase [Photobacterium sp. ZSDE20]MCQ1061286.1 tyrosine-type recombinase/integrase [Photobacterium sp. ZSDE20]MDD1829787.1 tyrosine-type recombinase/integrase [Photobacterium sp. ZSDE20]